MKFLVFLALIIIPFQTHAQSSVFSEQAVITIEPKIPAPGENVTATVRSSYYEDLSRAEIIWHIDDTERKREIGGKTFQFQAPPAGRNMELFVTVDRGPGSTFANFLNIKTGSVDLIYEANTYIPPFYKGRSLFAPQAVVTVAALATLVENGTPLPKNKIIYNWYKNDQLVSDISGVGKDSAKFESGFNTKPLNISVVVESITTDLKAKKRVFISPTNPKVVLYENNPIYGSVFEKALTGTFNFDREEVGITAIPYFFSADTRNSGDLKYSWFENGSEIGNSSFGSFINYLNPNKEKSGVSNLGVNVEHNSSFLQSGSNYFKVNVLGNQQSDTIKTNETSAF